MGVPVSEVLLFIACLVGSAFFSGAETAITAFGDNRARKRAEEGNAAFRVWLRHPERVLATLLIGNNLVNIGASALAADAAFHAGLPHAVAITTGAVTLLVLVFGEITPKGVARRHAHLLAPACLPIVVLMQYAIWPLAWLFAQIPRALTRGGEENAPSAVTSEEIEYLIDLGAREGVLDKVRGDLLARVLEFSEVVVKEVMTPRTRMVALEKEATLEETMSLIAESDLSRIPVYDGTPDAVVGVLNVKDVITELKRSSAPSPFALSRYVKPPFFVPELMKISRLLKEFQRLKTHIAIVVDEFGGTSGICTLEDVVEQIVGDIQDEYDTEERGIKVLGDGVILADGAVPIRDLEQQLGVDFPEDGSYETIGGFITATAGKVPPTGSLVVWNGLKFTIRAADDRRVLKVEIAARREETRPIAT